MSKKKLLSMCAVVALAAVAVVGGTLAYFTDTDKANNVMTIGDVKIDVVESAYDWGEGEWKSYPDAGIPAGEVNLVPVDHSDADALMATNQSYNKVVDTKNEGSEDAYIRTAIAVERVPYAGKWGSAVGLFFNKACSYPVMPEVVEIDGVEYDLYLCTEANGEAVAAGNYLRTLTGVFLYEDVTNEEAKAADGNLDIKVFSQAIQAAGFDHASAMAELDEAVEAEGGWGEYLSNQF